MEQAGDVTVEEKHQIHIHNLSTGWRQQHGQNQKHACAVFIWTPAETSLVFGVRRPKKCTIFLFWTTCDSHTPSTVSWFGPSPSLYSPEPSSVLRLHHGPRLCTAEHAVLPLPFPGLSDLLTHAHRYQQTYIHRLLLLHGGNKIENKWNKNDNQQVSHSIGFWGLFVFFKGNVIRFTLFIFRILLQTVLQQQLVPPGATRRLPTAPKAQNGYNAVDEILYTGH